MISWETTQRQYSHDTGNTRGALTLTLVMLDGLGPLEPGRGLGALRLVRFFPPASGAAWPELCKLLGRDDGLRAGAGAEVRVEAGAGAGVGGPGPGS